MWPTYLTVALVAYLLGSIPFGYILVKLFLKQDIRTTGSGNIGATNVARSGKKGLAIATLLLDAGKGAAAVIIVARSLHRFPRFFDAVLYQEFGIDIPDIRHALGWLALAAFFAVLGHCYPVWLEFRGGKGVATAIGSFLLVEPRAAGLAFVSFCLMFILSRFVSLSSITAAAAFPVLAWYFTRQPIVVLWSGLTSSLIILKHHANIRRLLNGTEPKFAAKKPAIPPDPIQVEKNA